MILNSLKEIEQIDFTVNNFNVRNKTVTPPTPFTCSKSTLLYERFFYVVKGKIVFNCHGQKQQEFPENSIVYLPYDVTYESFWDIGENGEFITVNFILKDKNEEIVSLSDKIMLIANDNSNVFLPLFQNINSTWSTGGIGYKTKCKSEFYNIIFKIISYTEHLELKRENRKIYKALLYLENNYTSDMSISVLADMANLKECMFRRIFKIEKGVSPVKYRNSLRLKKAYEMLQSGEFTVVETAVCTGFNDLPYFIRQFKKTYNMTPSKCIPH